MFANLIGSIAASAQSIAAQTGLPPEAQPLRTDAASFSSSLAPTLTQIGGQMAGFAQDAASKAVSLQPLVEQWQSGNPGALARIVQTLAAVLTGARALLDADQSAYRALSGYCDTIAGDQRTVAALQAQLSAQLAGLRSRLESEQSDLSSAQQRLAILQAIPFPLPWIIAEIVSLIGKKKTMEQDVVDLAHQVGQLNGQASAANQALGSVGSFGAQLQVLDTALQNLVNAVSVTQGQLQQVLGTLQAGQGSATPVVVAAYLATLKSQADAITQYLQA